MIANIALRVNSSLGTNTAVDIIINVPSVKNKFFFFMLIAFNKNRIICSITYESMRKLNIYFGLIPKYPPVPNNSTPATIRIPSSHEALKNHLN